MRGSGMEQKETRTDRTIISFQSVAGLRHCNRAQLIPVTRSSLKALTIL